MAREKSNIDKSSRKEMASKVFKVVIYILGILFYVVAFLFIALFELVVVLAKDSGKGRRKRVRVMCGPGGRSTWHSRKRYR